MNIQGKAKQITVAAKIIRADGQIEDLGTVAYSHRNPLRTLLWQVSQVLKIGQSLKKKKGR